MKNRKVIWLTMFVLFLDILVIKQNVSAQGNVPLTVMPPAGYEKATVFVDGREYSAVNNRDGSFTVYPDDLNAKTVVMYKYNSSDVPVGMYVWKLSFDGSAFTTVPIPEFEDLLTYHGFSIRITGVSGIRFKSGISTVTRGKLTSDAGLAGYHLVEYGTLYMTQNNRLSYPFVKGGDKVGSGRSYWTAEGSLHDKIVETVNGRYRFASVLVNLPAEQYNTEFAFRSYIILSDGTETITLYGPPVAKSIASLANQLNDMNKYQDGTGADLFIKRIIGESAENVKSKKGIQGGGYLYAEIERRGLKDYDWNVLGVNYVLMNLDLTSAFVSDSDNIQYTYKGVTYTFSHHINDQKWIVDGLHEHGVETTMVLLLSYDSKLKDLTYTGTRGTCDFHAWNLKSQESRDRYEAILSYLFTVAYPDVDHWVLGNEVNMPNNYNYTGTKDLTANVSIYADEFLFTYNLLKQYNSNGKLYISIDRCWNNADDGIAGNRFLPALIKEIEARQSNVNWNVAQHPYPPDMFSCNLWNKGQVKHEWNSPYLCATNIEVLTDWIKNNYGESHRVILSEVGFHAGAGEDAQAAAMAYTYYVAQFNPMIDQVIFRSYADDSNDGDLKLGFINANIKNGEQLIKGNARKCYSVFEYMDTEQSESYTSQYLNKTGAKDWISIVPKYNPYIFGALK